MIDSRPKRKRSAWKIGASCYKAGDPRSSGGFAPLVLVPLSGPFGTDLRWSAGSHFSGVGNCAGFCFSQALAERGKNNW